MFRPWMCIGVLVLMSVSVWADFVIEPKKPEKPEKPEKRVALVIGNAAYDDHKLINSVNDADSMAAALKACGFTVLKHTDLNRQEMFWAVRAFGDSIKGGGVGLFYYSGHSIQVDGKNYLLSVDADIQAEDEVKYVCLDMQLVMDKMVTARSRVNILILDASMDNPFERLSSAGLVQMSVPKNGVIAYATSLGNVALESPTRSNSYFTGALVEVIREPGLGIDEAFRKVRMKVIEETKGSQIPWTMSSLMEDFYFVDPTLPPTPSR